MDCSSQASGVQNHCFSQISLVHHLAGVVTVSCLAVWSLEDVKAGSFLVVLEKLQNPVKLDEQGNLGQVVVEAAVF